MMKLVNRDGEAVYYNSVVKGGKVKFVIVAASGQKLVGRDKESVRSRTFTTERAASKYMARYGYQ